LLSFFILFFPTSCYGFLLSIETNSCFTIKVKISSKRFLNLKVTLFPVNENIGNGTGIGTLIPIYPASISD
jgi:hypothetical protein